MKVLAVLSVVLAVAACYPVVKTWTLLKLSKAIITKSEPDLKPYLEDALNQIMYKLFTGDKDISLYTIPSPSGGAEWSIDELMAAKAKYPHGVKDDYVVAVSQAIAMYKHEEALGKVPESIKVVIPAMDISVWTLDDLKEVLNSDNISAELKSRLENELIKFEKLGTEDAEKTIGMVTPVGLIPPKNSLHDKKQKTKKNYRFKPLYNRQNY